MTVLDVVTDLEALTITMTAEFDAPVERLWEVWADPRLLERWWGPPTHPATFVEHDLTPGSRVTYFMTGPDGTRYHGWWDLTEVDENRRIAFRDGFADASGSPDPTMPVSTSEITFAPHEGGTRLVLVGRYTERASFDRVLEMGMAEGMTQAVSQIDALL